ncbi:MAG TPA: monovalent cation/H+ antiporter subunit D family protein, partial [Firmicutes bacterium]|nr:monovalent cation/H+ antiporter subunit D family protein [Bacillota bacterium]
MLNLILALISGALGGLITAGVSEANRRLRKIYVLAFTLGGMFFSWRTALAVFAGSRPAISGSLGGLDFRLAPDPLGAVFAIIVSTLWLFAALYSFGYMEEKENQRTYYSFFMVSLSATLGVALSGNLIALYLFYELLTLTTYPLVIHARTKEAMQAGKKYILYSLSGAGAILIAIVMTYARAGHLSFAGGPILQNSAGSGLNWLLFLFIAGFGVKAAVMPLHRWLPAAMVAPTPISALLHAVAVVYSGVYGILRIVYSVFGHELMAAIPFARILPWVAAFTILVGVILATRQDVLKRRLAYHTISQLSYILLGAFTLQPWGLTGAILHMISYSTLKITLFFCAGIIAEQTGEVNVSKMAGAGWSLPKTMASFGIASLGMVGMLPLNTFWSKFFLMRGGVAAGSWPLALVLIGSGVINAICFIPTVVLSFRADKEKHPYLERG